MSDRTTVMKFGGTSLEDGPGFDRVAGLLRSAEASGECLPVAIVSAMSGVTDALVRSLRLVTEIGSRKSAASLEPHFERHMEVAHGLGSNASSRMRRHVDRARKEVGDLLKLGNEDLSRRSDMAKLDEVSSYGEILSAQLLTLVLLERGSPATYVDARRCIKTNGTHGNAKPLTEATATHTRKELQALIHAKQLPVMGGFIGATREGITTTMGRGSSNHTATLVSAALNARETQIWTDVNGVQTADPCLVRDARTIPRLSYAEGEELARLGAKVLFEPMFEPVRGPQIPIRISNSRFPEAQGTFIGFDAGDDGSPPTHSVKAIAHKNHLVRIDVRSTPASLANGFERSIKRVMTQHRGSMQVVARSADGLSLVCDEDTSLGQIIHDLTRCGSVEVTSAQAVVGLVGAALQHPEHASSITEILNSSDSTLVWQPTSTINLVCLVDAPQVAPLVKRLHHKLFEQ